MIRRYKKLVKESRGSVYDMINAIEDRIDELENGYYDESVDLEEDYSTDDVRELVLYIINKAQLNNQVQSTIRNLKRKVARNMYDPDKAVDAFMYIAKNGSKMYDKEYGSYSGSSTWLNRDTLKAVATKLRDYYEEQIFEDTVSESFHKGRRNRRLSESSRKKYTQAQLRKMVRDGKAEDITNYSFEEANDLYDRGYDVIGVSTGTYGINGALLKMRDTGDLMVICARNSTLMQLV